MWVGSDSYCVASVNRAGKVVPYSKFTADWTVEYSKWLGKSPTDEMIVLASDLGCGAIKIGHSRVSVCDD